VVQCDGTSYEHSFAGAVRFRACAPQTRNILTARAEQIVGPERGQPLSQLTLSGDACVVAAPGQPKRWASQMRIYFLDEPLSKKDVAFVCDALNLTGDIERVRIPYLLPIPTRKLHEKHKQTGSRFARLGSAPAGCFGLWIGPQILDARHGVGRHHHQNPFGNGSSLPGYLDTQLKKESDISIKNGFMNPISFTKPALGYTEMKQSKTLMEKIESFPV